MPFKFKLSRRLARLKLAAVIAPLLPLACVSGDKLLAAPENPPPPPDAEVVRLVVSPSDATVRSNQTVDFSAVGLTAGGDTADVTVTWVARRGVVTESSDSKPGKRKGQYKAPTSTGTDTVVAIDGTGNADTATVTVTDVSVASLTVAPSSANINVGGTVQLQGTTKDGGGNTLTGRPIAWSSSSTGIATVSDQGLVTGRGAGSATITGTSEGVSGTSSITVTLAPVASVTVTPSSASVEVNKTVQLSATVKDAGGNTLTGRSLAWSSNATGIATVSSSGLVTGRAAGSATITATSEGKSGTSQITVSVTPVASVVVSPASANIDVGGNVQLSAVAKDATGTNLTGRTFSWSSSATAIATVSNTGLVTGVAAGSATITATSEGKSGTSQITVSSAPPPPPPPPPPANSCPWPWPAGVPAPMPASTGDTFYVATNGSDGASGSSSAPWRTLQHAFDVLSAGQVAIVRPGTYGGPGATMTWNKAGNASAPITVTGMPGQDKPVIIAEVHIEGSYLRLSHFIFEGNGNWGASSENGGYPLYFDTSGRAHHIELSFSEVYHSMKHSGISEYGTYIWILNNYVHDNGAFEDASTFNLSHGIYIHPTENLVIANNIFEHNRAKGISGRYDAHAVFVIHNTIVGNDRSGLSITEQAHDFLIANNLWVNNGNVDGGTGINTGGSSGGATIVEIHNIAWNNGTSGNSHWDNSATIDGNWAVDPLLVNPVSSVPNSTHQRWSNDYHLRSGSPAIGYADPRYVMPTDFEGRCRSATAPAVGAYDR